MTILVDQNTRVICQGITGRAGTHYSSVMLEYGTCVVGGVRPGMGGRSHFGLPVFECARVAVAATDAIASLVMVPPHNAA